MNFKRKIPSMLTMGAAALLASGAVMAAPPGSFQYGQYHVGDVTAGQIDSGTVACPAATCVDLLQDTGILQRNVTLNTGEQYIQTIVVEDAANTLGANAIVGTTINLPFTNESFVGVGGGANGDLASQNTVDLVGTPGFTGTTEEQNRVIAQIDQGGLASGGAVAKIQQLQSLDNNNVSNMKFLLLSNGDETDRYMRMDEVMTAQVAQGITVRRSSGSFTTAPGATNLTLPDGQVVTYNAGDDIGTTWIQLRNFGGAGLISTDDRVLQMQSFENNSGSPQFATWNSCNADGLGACNNVLDPGPYDWTPYWDPNGNFGTVPNPMVGTANPAGDNFFPNFGDQGPVGGLNVLGN